MLTDVREPFKFAPPKELPKLHKQASAIQDNGVKELGVSPKFSGSHFLTTDGRLIGGGKNEHRYMSSVMLSSFKDKDFNDRAQQASDKGKGIGGRWGIDGRNMDHLLEQTGMMRVSGNKTGINVDAKHPLTSSQRRVILNHIEDNSLGLDRIYIDDYTPEQNVQKSLRIRGESGTQAGAYKGWDTRGRGGTPLEIHKDSDKTLEDFYNNSEHSTYSPTRGDVFIGGNGNIIQGKEDDNGHAEMISPYLKDLDITTTDQESVNDFIDKTGTVRSKAMFQTISFQLSHIPTKSQIRGMKQVVEDNSSAMEDITFECNGNAPSEKQVSRMVLGVGWWNSNEAFVEQEHPRDHGKFTNKNGGSKSDNPNKPKHSKDFGKGLPTKNKDAVERQIKEQYPQLDANFIKTQLKKADEIRNNIIKPHKDLCDELQAANKNVVVAGRIKEADSMVGKLARRPDDYKIVQDLNDISGVRATAKSIGEVKEVMDYIKEHYDIIQEKNNIDEDRGGYRSYHAVIMKDGIKHEFQLRTENQDKWADYAHDNFYKPANAKQADFFNRHKERINDYTLDMSNYFYEKDMGRNIKKPDCPPMIMMVVDCL